MESESIVISPPVLKELVNSLTNLQRLEGPARDDKLWSFMNIDIRAESTGLLERSELLTVIDSLKRLETVKDALQKLTTSCERELERLKNAVLPHSFHSGIQVLPDDVLSGILKLVVEKSERVVYEGATFSSPLVLSHVCSRFRAISLVLPSLWTRVSSNMTLDFAKTCLERSCTLGLMVFIDLDEGSTMAEEDFKGFLQLMSNNVSRWKSLVYRLGKYAWWPSPAWLAKSLTDLDFSQLECFDFRHEIKEWEETPENVDLLRGWNMPNVCHLSLTAVQPTRKSSFFSSSVIRTVEFHSQYWKRDFDVRAFADFLESLPSLIDLRLDLSGCSMEDISRSCDIVLPNLSHMTLEIVDLDLFREIVNRFRTPAVKTLRLGFRNSISLEPPDSSPGEFLKAIPSGTFTSVKSLDLACRDKKHASFDLVGILENFPDVEHINVDAPDNCCYFGYIYSDNIPPLRSLRMRLETVDSGVLNKLFFRGLHYSKKWDQFESFDLTTSDSAALKNTIDALKRKGKKARWYMSPNK